MPEDALRLTGHSRSIGGGNVKDYRSLEAAARRAQTAEATLLEFGSAGWIEFVSKEGQIYISGQDEYKCRFILHLRQKLGLSDKQIGIVLAKATAPYSPEQVADILGGIDQISRMMKKWGWPSYRAKQNRVSMY